MTMYQSRLLKSYSIVRSIFINVIFIFSSPELKVQVGFLDFPCLSLHLSLQFHIMFSPEQLGQFN